MLYIYCIRHYFSCFLVINLRGQAKIYYSSLIINKGKRLLSPFISVAVMFFFVKYTVGKLVALEHSVTLNTLFYLFMVHVHSYTPLLWLLYTLSIIFLSTTTSLDKKQLSDFFIKKVYLPEMYLPGHSWVQVYCL